MARDRQDDGQHKKGKRHRLPADQAIAAEGLRTLDQLRGGHRQTGRETGPRIGQGQDGCENRRQRGRDRGVAACQPDQRPLASGQVRAASTTDAGSAAVDATVVNSTSANAAGRNTRTQPV